MWTFVFTNLSEAPGWQLPQVFARFPGLISDSGFDDGRM
jgi:hypothetical protein